MAARRDDSLAARGRFFFGRGGPPVRGVGVNFDIPEREQTEAALRELVETLEQRVEVRTLRQSEQRFSQTFHAAPVPTCITTLKPETLLEVNEAFLELTGYSRGEVVGRTSRELGMWSSPKDQRTLRNREPQPLRNLDLRARTKGRGARPAALQQDRSRDAERGNLRVFLRRNRTQPHRAADAPRGSGGDNQYYLA